MYRIKWHPLAEKEYYDILEYWIEHNQSNTYSLKIASELVKNLEILRVNPYIGSNIIGAKNNIKRIFILKNFSIYYLISVKTIKIIMFSDNRDNPDKLNTSFQGSRNF